MGPCRGAFCGVVAFLLAGQLVAGQGRTDVVTLANGDRITGEITRLERGKLEFKTDDIGTLDLEWDKLVSVVSRRLVEVETTDGRVFLGTLESTIMRWLSVVTATGVNPVAMSDVAQMTAIGRSFWRKLDGSFDAGFTYSKSSGVAQLYVNSETFLRRPRSETRLTFGLTQTQTDEETGSDDRAAFEGQYVHYPWVRRFVTVIGRIETNESLGLELRAQIGGAIGPRLIYTNRALMSIGAGMVFNDEQGVDAERTQNLDALIVFRAEYYTYDRPKTNLYLRTQSYPSLSNLGRHRLQLDASAKRELWKDLFLSLSVYDTFDSQPPNADAADNDVGVVFSVGWTY